MTKNKYKATSPRNRSLVENRRITSGSIRVIIRVRPPNKKEASYLNNKNDVVKIIDDQTIVFDPKEEEDPFYYHGVRLPNRDLLKRVKKNIHFSFDRIFGFESTNAGVFENSINCLIGTLMDGYNCSIFAYGATGSGKTHTMLGNENNSGLMFLTMIELFHRMDLLSLERNFKVDVTYLEVYNENIRDLLNPELILCLREHKKYGVMVTGLQVHNIENISKMFELLEKGNSNRSQHYTDSNRESSRSHAVFQVYLKMDFKNSAVGTTRIAKLSMIDLAGSERGAATGNSIPRFKEGANINKSLLALGNCINSLAEGKKHIPYRDSKLTRLLKDSLGGNCQTVMVANISPSFLNYEETHNTLKYAMRATKIKLNLKKNVIHSEGTFLYYIELVDKLSKEILQLKQALSIPCICNKNEDESFKVTKFQFEMKDFYDEKQKVLNELLGLESTQKLLILKQQFKKEQLIAIDMMCNNQTDKSITLHFKNILKQMDNESSVLRTRLINLKDQNGEIEVKILESLENIPELRNYAEKENLQIACIKSQHKVEHLKKVCELQTQEIEVRNQIIKQFSETLATSFTQLQQHGIITSHLFHNYQQLEGCLYYLKNYESEIEEKSNTAVIPLNKNIKSHKRKHSEQLSRNSTFVITSGKMDIDYPEKVWKKGNPIASKPKKILSTRLDTKVRTQNRTKK